MARSHRGSVYRKTRTVNGRSVKSSCYYGSFVDPQTGRRVTRKLFTDRQASRRELDRLIQDAERRAVGIIDRYADHRDRPISDHIEAYLAHCEHVGQARRHLQVKTYDLNRLIDDVAARRLTDLDPERVEQHLRRLRQQGLSARKVNAVRAHAVAFLNWCVKTGRCPDNPLKIVPKLDERRDRRRVRRPLTDEELGRLIAVALPRGRALWYLTAALAGLRKGDLQQLRWADIDFETRSLIVRNGKAKRDDRVPLHPQLVDALQAEYEAVQPSTNERVFRTTVTDRTRQKDFLRAGLAREQVVRDQDGEPVMVGKGKRRRPKTRIVTEDAEGRVIDLHAMRTTLGTNLAKAGVIPQLAQKIMRHADYRTTLNHYTVLGFEDTARAMADLPGITAAEATDVEAPVAAQRVHSGSVDVSERRYGRTKPNPDRADRGRAQVESETRVGTRRHRRSSRGDRKRVKGFEPSTFSLGS